MIRYIRRKEIDIAKYDACIETAINARIYAYSWYLDIVADNWDALVLDDYKAVMPLPWRSKYFIKYIYPPAWTQQLGIFYKFEICANLTKEFIDSIPKKFKKVTIQFNSENDLSLFETEKRVNYILPLNKPYEEIYKGLKNNRKYSINLGQKNNLFIRNVLVDDLIILANKYYTFLNISDINYNKLIKLSKSIIKNKNGFLLGVYNRENDLLGGSIFLKDAHRICYLFSVVTPEGKQKQVASVLINDVIKMNSNSNCNFDFEGSMIGGIADFYKSFGGQVENYFSFQKNSFV